MTQKKILAIEETERFIEDALKFAAICAAQKVNIQCAEILPLEDLNSILEKASPSLFDSLQTFRNKYHQWVDFHKNSSYSSSNHVQVNIELEIARQKFIDVLKAANG